jgi:precorrin-8X/cobalt-precorrin-8 methylmutase
MKKVLGIQASPNENGHTSKLTQVVLNGAEAAGAEVELVHLNRLNISACKVCDQGWGICKTEGNCVIQDDDFQSLRDKMYSADAIVFNTPVYFGSISETARCFLDRLRRCEVGNRENSLLNGKPAIGMASAKAGGDVKALCELEGYLRFFKLKICDLIPASMRNSEYKLEMLKAAGSILAGARFGSPEDIERRSFDILSKEADLSDVPPEKLPIVQRVIHATADFEYKNTLVFHPDAVKTGIDAIKAGRDILTDVEMVRVGINKKLLEKWGGKVVCKISDEDVAELSKETGKTRSEIAIEKGIGDNIGIIAIGNAPTALLKAIEILGNRDDLLVVGVPVGFVKALDSKSLLAKQDLPFITNLSRKGGSSVAVSVVNALLKMADSQTPRRKNA